MAYTKLPPSLIADGAVGSILVRNELGVTTDAMPDSFLKFQYGMELSWVSNNTLGISLGRRVNGSVVGLLVADITKTTAAFVVGTGNGSRTGAALANSTFYYVHLIYNSGTDVTDVLIHTSATAPTLPPGFAAVKRLGAIYINASGNIEQFVQIDKYFGFCHIQSNGLVTNTAVYNVTHTVPNQISGVARLHASLLVNGGGGIASLLTPQNLGYPIEPDPNFVLRASMGGVNGFVNNARNSWIAGIPFLNSSIFQYEVDTSGPVTTRTTYHFTHGWEDLGI